MDYSRDDVAAIQIRDSPFVSQSLTVRPRRVAPITGSINGAVNRPIAESTFRPITGSITGSVTRSTSLVVGVLATFVSLTTSCSPDPSPSSGALSTPPPALDASRSTNPFRIGRTLVIPHAGGDGMFPQNTVYAYEHSLAMGADVVDIDVQLSADGVPIAMHDSRTDRTTGVPGEVAAMKAAAIEALDAGWYFERDGQRPFRGKGITVPTVETVLRRFPTSLTTLDVKDQRIAVVRPICELLHKLERVDTVYVGVDTDEQVDEFRRLCPDVHTSGTSAERRAARTARENGDLAYRSTQRVGQPSYLADDGTKRVTAESLAFSHRFDTAILTWVVDDPDHMAELIALGVDGIYTRRPDLLIPLVRGES